MERNEFLRTVVDLISQNHTAKEISDIMGMRREGLYQRLDTLGYKLGRRCVLAAKKEENK